MFDTHAHLDMSEFDSDLESMLDRAMTSGVDRILTVGIDMESSLRAVALAKKHRGLYAATGCHPHNSRGFTDLQADSLAELASAPEVVAWGEIGLDFFRDNSPRDAQRSAFLCQLQRARDLGMPAVIHNREAHEEVLAAARRLGKRDRCGVIHCFSGDLSLAAEFIALGYHISIPGTVTYPKAAMVRETAAGIPLERMLLETDAPYLAPVPRRGRRNEPSFIVHTVKAVAGLRGMEAGEISRITTANAEALFGVPDLDEKRSRRQCR